MAKQVLEILRAKFGEAVVLATHESHGDDTATVVACAWLDVASFLKTDPGCDMQMLVDLCGADYPARVPRLEVVAHLHSLRLGHRVRVKAAIGDSEGDLAEIQSVITVWPGANWFERETFDMFGIRFIGHPDLRRIFLYDEFVGHPLRKDYPAAKTHPLVPYRQGPNVLDKLPPFGPEMGMSFARKSLDDRKGKD